MLPILQHKILCCLTWQSCKFDTEKTINLKIKLHLFMNNTLYPLKFSPIYKTTLWGGNSFNTVFNRKNTPENCGESWEISGVKDNVSVVCNGFLAGNQLDELLEIYMGDLVGDNVYEKFGNNFPLLIKFIDACDNLSVQVHPDDNLAAKRHNSFGKTEMWYVLNHEKNAELINGFNRKISKQEYLDALNSGKLTEILNSIKVNKGDVFFIPAGRVHAIGKGILIAEIQQTSDITYRIFDFNRVGKDGKQRQLHTELAVDAIDYNFYENYRSDYKPEIGKTVNVVDCNYFTTNVIRINQPLEKDYPEIDSFVIYICTEGKCNVAYGEKDEKISLQAGETLLIPAMIKNVVIYPEEETNIVETYIK